MRHPSRFRHLVAAAAVVVTLAVAATRARADVPPPDLCTAPGQSCMNAGPQFNGAGTCVATTCTKQVPAPDGGMMPMTYDCNLCKAPDAGTGGGGGSSGCAVVAERGGAGSLAATAWLIAAVVLAISRRRNAGE
jgi:hypothetical protein